MSSTFYAQQDVTHYVKYMLCHNSYLKSRLSLDVFWNETCLTNNQQIKTTFKSLIITFRVSQKVTFNDLKVL